MTLSPATKLLGAAKAGALLLVLVFGVQPLPAVAHERERFTRLGSDSSEATNDRGRLPGNLIGKVGRAKEADRLDGFGPSAFVHPCQAGALRGEGHVTPDIGPDMQEVPGFSTSYPAGAGASFDPCLTSSTPAQRPRSRMSGPRWPRSSTSIGRHSWPR